MQECFVLFVFVTPSVMAFLSVSVSLSFSSLQGISLFYEFTTYSNDSDVFDSVEIDNVNLIGTFSNASTYVLTTTSLALHNIRIPSVDWLICVPLCISLL